MFQALFPFLFVVAAGLHGHAQASAPSQTHGLSQRSAPVPTQALASVPSQAQASAPSQTHGHALASAPAPSQTQAPAPSQMPVPDSGILVGMTDTAAYFPLLERRRVAVLANHTSVAELPGAAGADGRAVATDAQGRVHLVDLLHARGFDVTGIFSPEHGFRGTADAGERVGSSVDARTGIPIRSLYDGRTLRPSDDAMRSFDVLVVDLQDVGLRFYTYYISMLRMMDACAAFGRRVVVLDRPNPHGEKIDGPVLDMRYKSGVGALPIPVLHGLTMGEIARMAVGEGWAARCELTVVRCRNYTHADEYVLPVAPSPNLPTQRAVYLYPSLCLFEGTVVSVGRGTDKPFEMYGHPALAGYPATFTPRPTAGAKQPPLEGEACRGEDLSGMPLAEARRVGLSLRWLIDAWRALAGEAAAMPAGKDADSPVRAAGKGANAPGGTTGKSPDRRFFTPMFEKLIGAGYVREMIEAGASEAEIRARWQQDLVPYRSLRSRYLLYP